MTSSRGASERDESAAAGWAVGAHNSVVGADQGFRAPSWDQESVRDSGHEDSASALIAAGQRPRQSFRAPLGPIAGVVGDGVVAVAVRTHRDPTHRRAEIQPSQPRNTQGRPACVKTR